MTASACRGTSANSRWRWLSTDALRKPDASGAQSKMPARSYPAARGRVTCPRSNGGCSNSRTQSSRTLANTVGASRSRKLRMASPDLPSGTVTFLFSDIEGSTRLLHELGDAYADALAQHRRVLRE